MIQTKENVLRKYQLTIIGIILGAIGGYLYYHFVGCNSGTCAITSKPINSSLYGALMGGLTGNIFKKSNAKQPTRGSKKIK
ncbi:MAG: DUF6132 family protein [Ginsengibacter sp.]